MIENEEDFSMERMEQERLDSIARYKYVASHTTDEVVLAAANELIAIAESNTFTLEELKRARPLGDLVRAEIARMMKAQDENPDQ